MGVHEGLSQSSTAETSPAILSQEEIIKAHFARIKERMDVVARYAAKGTVVPEKSQTE